VDKELKALIDNWEGSPLVAGFELAGTRQRIIKNDHGLYSLLRYFTVFDKWHVSVDKANVEADEIIMTLAELVSD